MAASLSMESGCSSCCLLPGPSRGYSNARYRYTSGCGFYYLLTQIQGIKAVAHVAEVVATAVQTHGKLARTADSKKPVLLLGEEVVMAQA